MNSTSMQLADRDEEFNTRLASYRGWQMVIERVKPIPRTPARLQLAGLVMACWHTAMPNSGEEHGWVGRLADAIDPQNTAESLVNIDETQSLAVRARGHLPLTLLSYASDAVAGFMADLDRIGRAG